MTLREQLIRHEGLNLKPYYDASVPARLTIGIGRNLDDVGITRDEALYLLDNDIKAVYRSLSQFVWFNSLGDVRQQAIANMAFNIGIKGLLGFKKMIAALESQNYEGAAREAIDSVWAAQVGARAEELSFQLRTGQRWPEVK